MENISELRKMTLIKLIKTLCASEHFPNFCTMLARKAAAKSHSSDIKCSINIRYIII
jgi:hypothetical protein